MLEIRRSSIRQATRRSALRFVAAIVLFSGAGLVAPRAAWAHALLVSSQPAENSTVTGPEVAIVLKYNSRVDPVHSSVSLRAPDGKVEKVAIGRQASPNVLSANVTGMSKGAYMLRWQALSSDGHITRGEFAFHVE